MGENTSGSSGYRVLHCQPADCYHHVRRRLCESSPRYAGRDPAIWL